MRYEDPSIQKAAVSLAAEAWDDTERMVRAGIDFYRARELALGSRAGGWAKTYGKDCAERAVRMVHAMDPGDRASFSAETLACKAEPPLDTYRVVVASVVALLTFLLAPPSLVVWLVVAIFGKAGVAGGLLLLSGILAAYMFVGIYKEPFHI